MECEVASQKEIRGLQDTSDSAKNTAVNLRMRKCSYIEKSFLKLIANTKL
jgi:hypothetical protein